MQVRIQNQALERNIIKMVAGNSNICFQTGMAICKSTQFPWITGNFECMSEPGQSTQENLHGLVIKSSLSHVICTFSGHICMSHGQH